MNILEEEYIHLESCVDDLNRARSILLEVKEHPGHKLVGPAFQFALIEYAKPYKASRGVNITSKGKPVRHRLDSSLVPRALRDLHNRLLAARDKIHAHSDLSVRDAKLYVEELPDRVSALTVKNVIDWAEEIENIDSIIDLIEQTLQKMYAELEAMKLRLPKRNLD